MYGQVADALIMEQLHVSGHHSAFLTLLSTTKSQSERQVTCLHDMSKPLSAETSNKQAAHLLADVATGLLDVLASKVPDM